MAPPDLARNAPRLDVLHPVEERRLPLRGHELGLALAHRLDCRLGQCLRVDIPLIGEIGLDHGAGTVAVRHDVRRRLDLVEQPGFLQPLDDSLARREAIEAVQAQRRVKVGR